MIQFMLLNEGDRYIVSKLLTSRSVLTECLIVKVSDKVEMLGLYQPHNTKYCLGSSNLLASVSSIFD